MGPSSVLESHWKSERELVSAAVAGESGAREQLVDAFLPQISRAAFVYRNTRAVERSELIQDGIVGLLRALERYDESRGTPFWPYASWWVRQSMQQLVAEMSRQVVLSDRALRRLSRIKDARALWLRTKAREPTVRELTEWCGCGREDIERLLAAEMPSRALDEPSSPGDSVGDTLGQRLGDETSGDDYDAVVDRARLRDLRARCGALPDRERYVLYAHFGMTGRARTLRDIATELSLSVERIRQIEEAALERLRDGLSVGTPGTSALTPRLRPVDPGDSPEDFRHVLARELAAEGWGERVSQDLVVAAHEITAGVWLRGRAPQHVGVGAARDAAVCEVSDPAAGPTSRIAARIVSRLTSRIDRLRWGSAATFRLWA
jgi:RNA polymerase sigma factor (sigma-70 family)